jgi:type II secretory pathway pseudopilin PulG
MVSSVTGLGSLIAKPAQGFTIIEVLIVLAVTALLGITALLALSGRIDSTNLEIASNNFALAMKQSITDSLSSYLSDYSSLYCTSTGDETPVKFSTTQPPAGQPNLGCIFLGSVVQFAPMNQPSEFINYPIAGNQTYYSQEVENLTEAVPEPIVGAVNLSQVQTIGDGITVSSLKADGNSTGAIAFMLGDLSRNLATYDSSTNNLNPGDLAENLYYVKGTLLGQTSSAVTSNITASNFISASNVQICLYEGSQKSVEVTISGSDNLNVTSTNFASSTCS